MAKLKCKLKGHQLITVNTANVLIKKYQCKNCKQLFTINGYGKMVKMNSDWEKNHQLFANYYQNKKAV